MYYNQIRNELNAVKQLLDISDEEQKSKWESGNKDFYKIKSPKKEEIRELIRNQQCNPIRTNQPTQIIPMPQYCVKSVDLTKRITPPIIPDQRFKRKIYNPVWKFFQRKIIFGNKYDYQPYPEFTQVINTDYDLKQKKMSNPRLRQMQEAYKKRSRSHHQITTQETPIQEERSIYKKDRSLIKYINQCENHLSQEKHQYKGFKKRSQSQVDKLIAIKKQLSTEKQGQNTQKKSRKHSDTMLSQYTVQNFKLQPRQLHTRTEKHILQYRYEQYQI